MRPRLALTTLLCCMPMIAAASGWESPERLRMAAAAALGGSDAEISLDPNTRLPRCAEMPRGLVRARSTRSASVEISCDRPAWRVFVPARSSGEQQVAVLRRPLAAGETLSADMFDMQLRSTAGLGYGWFEDRESMAGRRTRRALPAGTVLTPQDLEADQVVTTGESVTLVSRAHGIEVRMQGQAVSGGAAHQRIRVKNLSSGRILEGTVRGAGEVEIGAQ
jgi:flagella basal body P-ring formation protein FlgA